MESYESLKTFHCEYQGKAKKHVSHYVACVNDYNNKSDEGTPYSGLSLSLNSLTGLQNEL